MKARSIYAIAIYSICSWVSEASLTLCCHVPANTFLPCVGRHPPRDILVCSTCSTSLAMRVAEIEINIALNSLGIFFISTSVECAYPCECSGVNDLPLDFAARD